MDTEADDDDEEGGGGDLQQLQHRLSVIGRRGTADSGWLTSD